MQANLQESSEEMKEAGTNVHVVSTIDDICWTLNIRGNDIDFFPLVLSYGIITMDSFELYIDEKKLDDKLKAKLAKEITESMKKERDIEQERVDAAHKANQEIYENATGQRKTVLENVKMSELYNADGSFNDAAYNETVELLEGIGGSDLVQVFKQLASEMQKNSQVYLEGTENIRNLNNEIQDQEQEEANQKIELETQSL